MSVLTRCALPMVVFVAALLVSLTPSAAWAATQDVSITPDEAAQGRPDDWGSPQGKPDDWGKPGAAASSEEDVMTGKPDDWGVVPDSELEIRIAVALLHLGRAF